MNNLNKTPRAKAGKLQILRGIAVCCLTFLLSLSLAACAQQVTIRPLATTNSQADQAAGGQESLLKTPKILQRQASKALLLTRIQSKVRTQT